MMNDFNKEELAKMLQAFLDLRSEDEDLKKCIICKFSSDKNNVGFFQPCENPEEPVFKKVRGKIAGYSFCDECGKMPVEEIYNKAEEVLARELKGLPRIVN